MDILQIANKIQKEGGNLYLVGGAVRDKLLKKEIKDEDYCVVGLTEKVFLELFPEAKPRGKSFQVYEIEGREFALARREKKVGDGHTAFEIEIGEKVTIEEDLARRDITINSMAIHVQSNTLIDPYEGQKDIKQKKIRKTSKAFYEDPLRAYRVARFATILKFKVEEDTIKEMKQMKQELYSLSKERIWEECKKALEAERPSIFFEVLKKAEILEVHFKEIQQLIGSLQPEKYHPEGDSYAHTMQVLDMASELTKEKIKQNKEQALQIRFASLVHDLGKGTTPKQMQPHHYGHEERGVVEIEKFAKSIAIPNNFIKCGKTATKEHMRGGIFEKMKDSTKADFLTRVDKSLLGLEGLEIVVKADKSRGNIENTKQEIFEKLGRRMLKEVTAKEIEKKYGIKQSIQVGKLLREERIEWIKKEHREK